MIWTLSCGNSSARLSQKCLLISNTNKTASLSIRSTIPLVMLPSPPPNSTMILAPEKFAKDNILLTRDLELKVTAPVVLILTNNSLNKEPLFIFDIKIFANIGILIKIFLATFLFFSAHCCTLSRFGKLELFDRKLPFFKFFTILKKQWPQGDRVFCSLAAITIPNQLIRMSIFYKRTFLSMYVAGLLGLSTTCMLAQSDPTGERRVTGTYAITNATVIATPGSAASKATVIIKNGLIDQVGKNPTIPLDAQTIKGDSLFVYAGFIDVANSAGVSAPSIPERPSNFDPSDPAPVFVGITPQYHVLDYYEAGGEEAEKWRKSGVTVFQLLPNGEGMLPGKTAVVLN